MSLAVSSAAYLARLGISTDPGTFGLHAARPIDAVANTVTWTWPVGLIDGITSNVVIFYQLTLQRAVVPANRPNSLVLYDVALRTAPVADTRWTTLQTWNRTQFLADPIGQGSGFVDAWAKEFGFCHYRLILNFTSVGGDPVQPLTPHGEMSWNVAIAVPPYPLSICNKQGGMPPGTPACDPAPGVIRLNWTAPQFQQNFLTFLGRVPQSECGPDANGCYKLGVSWPYTPLPLTFRVFKSSDGITYNLAVPTVDTTKPLWYDSDPAHLIYYKFLAVEVDLSTIESNVITATY